ncbi:MAG: carbamoyltransferase HypF [Methyloprofundus sp.]|nr:carbamoyltransferase HypF [Methyloprofundus sp.]
MPNIMQHLQIQLQGLLQGVGFRPFVYRLAQQYQQHGWVANTSAGIILHIQGEQPLQARFLSDLQQCLPPFASIHNLSSRLLPLANFTQFSIQASQQKSQASALVLADIATCPNCVSELFDPNSRYYQYPLISCCHCGPRYSIMLAQPYDRKHTSMAEYPLCPTCLQAYQDPQNRRFHAQTLACVDCGPTLSFLDAQGQPLAHKAAAISHCIQQLQAGKIIAVKAIGGYQLLVDANNQQAVQRLRQKKHRPAKPFALLAKDMAMVKSLCAVNPQEQHSLQSAMAPIVLLKKHSETTQYKAVAPNNDLLGMMLPSSGVQHLIMRAFQQPLIATSANRSGEPICTTEKQALSHLHGIADGYLIHKRAIIRTLDDSIVRIIADKPRLFRRARGYVPTPLKLPIKQGTLALGGHLKSTWAYSYAGYVLLSQYLGDLNNSAAQENYRQTLADMQNFYQSKAQRLIHDSHPDYYSSHYATQSPLSKTTLQHHTAHAFSCMAEHHISPPVLAVVWDGTGLGTDHSSWGGEFFLIKKDSIQRYAHFKPFPLLGGDKANQEPRRVALALLLQLFGTRWKKEVTELACVQAFTVNELKLFKAAFKHQLNTPLSSSAGRLFDAVASVLDLCQINLYEGQAAQALESATHLAETDAYYAYQLNAAETLEAAIQIDWQPLVIQILNDLKAGNHALIATKFHNTLADIILQLAKQADEPRIILSGGCFQNAYLTEKTQQLLSNAGFQVNSHEQIPSNDAGLALGQLYFSQWQASGN